MYSAIEREKTCIFDRPSLDNEFWETINEQHVVVDLPWFENKLLIF